MLLTPPPTQTSTILSRSCSATILQRRGAAATRWSPPDTLWLNLVLEIKGEEDERDRAKAAGAERWKDAVNYAGTFGCWEYQVCRDVDALRTLIDVVVTGMG
jgi:hypothetical protein